MAHALRFSLLIFWITTGALLADPSTDPGSEEYLLRFQLQAGERIRWQVVHLASTETQIKGNSQSSKSRSESTKLWEITEVDAEGNITFVHSVERVNMWQHVSDRPEVRYVSDSGDPVPEPYRHVADTVGVPLTTATISPAGEIVERGEKGKQAAFGLGDLVMLLPPKPVRVGSQWYEPSELQIRESDGRIKKIKIRKLYTLVKVQTGVATISVKTQVLTPIDQPAIQSQLVQQLTNGTIRFDIEDGRVLSRQMDWDETVVGFNGADSMMKYLARYTEELTSAEPGDVPAAGPVAETAQRPTPAGPEKPR